MCGRRAAIRDNGRLWVILDLRSGSVWSPPTPTAAAAWPRDDLRRWVSCGGRLTGVVRVRSALAQEHEDLRSSAARSSASKSRRPQEGAGSQRLRVGSTLEVACDERAVDRRMPESLTSTSAPSGQWTVPATRLLQQASAPSPCSCTAYGIARGTRTRALGDRWNRNAAAPAARVALGRRHGKTPGGASKKTTTRARQNAAAATT